MVKKLKKGIVIITTCYALALTACSGGSSTENGPVASEATGDPRNLIEDVKAENVIAEVERPSSDGLQTEYSQETVQLYKYLCNDKREQITSSEDESLCAFVITGSDDVYSRYKLRAVLDGTDLYPIVPDCQVALIENQSIINIDCSSTWMIRSVGDIDVERISLSYLGELPSGNVGVITKYTILFD